MPVSYTHLDVYKRQAYAMRFYELMSGQTKPLFVLLAVSYTHLDVYKRQVLLEGPDGLRERFYLQGKYEKVNDFQIGRAHV